MKPITTTALAISLAFNMLLVGVGIAGAVSVEKEHRVSKKLGAAAVTQLNNLIDNQICSKIDTELGKPGLCSAGCEQFPRIILKCDRDGDRYL